VCEEAADEIERLRKALRTIAGHSTASGDVYEICRKALSKHERSKCRKRQTKAPSANEASAAIS
jgi:hypothetical protein